MSGKRGLCQLVVRSRKSLARKRSKQFLWKGTCPCVYLAIVPNAVDCHLFVDARAGAHGGIAVGSMMQASAPRVFAGGDCACACACGRVARTPVGCFSKRLFGLSVCTAGLALGKARSLGLDAIEASVNVKNSGGTPYSRPNEGILGLPEAGPGCESRVAGDDNLVADDG